MVKKTLWIKDEYLQQILDGRKTIEVRVGYTNIRKLAPGDTLLLNNQYPYQIIRIGVYANIEELANHEDPAHITPDLSAKELIMAFRAIYPPEKEALGVIALELSTLLPDS